MKIKAYDGTMYDVNSTFKRAVTYKDFIMEISLKFDHTAIDCATSKYKVANSNTYFGVVWNSSMKGFVLVAETISDLIEQFCNYVDFYKSNTEPITYLELIERISKDDAPKIIIVNDDEYFWNGENYEIGIATSLHEEYSLKDLLSNKIDIKRVIDPDWYDRFVQNIEKWNSIEAR